MRARRLSWIGPVALALTLAWSGRAEACRPSLAVPVAIPRPSWPAGVELVDETIEVECGRVGPLGGSSHCRWRAVWVYEGVPGTQVDGSWTLGPADVEDIEVKVDGAPVELRHPGRGSVAGLHAVDAARIEVSLDVALEVYTHDLDTCTWPAAYARHFLVAAKPQLASFIVHEGEVPGFADARTHLHVRAPIGWHVDLDHGPDARGRALDTTIESRRLYRVHLERRGVGHGPFVAAGVGFGPQIRARLRAGYEVAAPAYLLYSVAVEGDAVEELLLAPAIEIATPSIWGIIPSAGLGVGAPVMLLPEPRPGFRAQWSLAWPFAGLVGTLDVYPQPGKPALRGGLLLQISL